jgi:LAO/AO transport system kinase
MDAMGMEVVIIETVGVGQDEIDIVRLAHTTVVVSVPGLGDDIQAIKAGVLEIGDVFVVNKADREGADRTARELAAMLEMKKTLPGDWLPKVMMAEASRNRGIAELVDEISLHRSWLAESGTLERIRQERSVRHFEELLRERLFAEVFGHIRVNGRYREIVEAMSSRRTDPYSAVDTVISERFGEHRQES